MFDFIIGDVVSINEDYVVINNNNIGYRINTSITSMMDMEVGNVEQKMYTKLYLRDDAILIYGFVTEDEMEMFDLLLKVPSIGPKTGLNILSTINPDQIKLAIHNEDIKLLTKAPGIGKKTAERMILELRDKIGDIEDINLEKSIVPTREKEEAIDGLTSLGYMRYEVEKAINKIDLEGKSIEDIIREGLKILSDR